MFRFIHSSDLHLGKRFGNFSGDLPSRLREARHMAIARLADLATAHQASTILLAGDTFDSETPGADVRRQALAEMAHHSQLQWVILPGNHDSLQAVQLWANLASEQPDNVILATQPQPVMLRGDVALLPAPCTTRRPGRDLTAWMDDAETAEGVMRIGLAHGAIQDFSEDAAASEVIAPDRARRARLDYLALGDWHGMIRIDARSYYSGTPEPDRFKHDRPASCLLVSLEAAGVEPEVRALESGLFAWQQRELHLLAGEDPLPALAACLPDMRLRRHTLSQIVASGRSRLAERLALSEAVTHAAPDFAFLTLDESLLESDYAVDDLDQIDRAGALRDAAEALFAQSQDDSLSAAERDIAGAALSRLYSYARSVMS